MQKSCIPQQTSNTAISSSRFILLIGLQASGKTTFATTHLADAIRVSQDDLGTRARVEAALAEALASDRDVVIDRMNVTRKERTAFIALARAHRRSVVGYFFESRVADCVQRNAMRDESHCVPRLAIAGTSRRLELPARDEGFDELYFVRLVPDGFEVTPWKDPTASTVCPLR